MDISGLKKTKARVSILELLDREKSPVDVNLITRRLKEMRVGADQATVYRILDAFYKKGIVDRVELGEGKYRYELSAKGHHHHLVCDNCGRIEDVEDKMITRIENKIVREKKFKTRRHSLEFFGLCRRCSN